MSEVSAEQVKAWREWEAHHNRTHSGDLSDCTSRACQVVADRLTDPSLDLDN